MTDQDLAKIKFRFVMSMSLSYEHMLSYESVGHIPFDALIAKSCNSDIRVISALNLPQSISS